MAVVRIGEIGEMTCGLDVVAGVAVSAVFTHNRAQSPVFVLYRANRTERVRATIPPGTNTVIALPPGQTVSTQQIVHPSFGTVTVLVTPPFSFIEHA